MQMTCFLAPYIASICLLTTHGPVHCGSNIPLVGLLATTFCPTVYVVASSLQYQVCCCAVDSKMLASLIFCTLRTFSEVTHCSYQVLKPQVHSCLGKEVMVVYTQRVVPEGDKPVVESHAVESSVRLKVIKERVQLG